MNEEENFPEIVKNEDIEKAWKNYEKLQNSGEVLDSTELYRHYDAWNRLLYVGISSCAVERLSAHMAQCDWRKLVTRIEIERWPTRELALLAEKQAIKTQFPYFNRTHAVILKKWTRPNAKRHKEFCGDRSCNGQCIPKPMTEYIDVRTGRPWSPDVSAP